MKKVSFLFLATLVAFCALFLNSCSEDAPEYQNSAKDLVGKWTWNTDAGDLNDIFDVTISQQDESTIKISNFHNLGYSIDAKISGTTISFSGELGSQFEVRNGTGTISNGYQRIKLKYECYDEDEETSENVEATLNVGVVSKKAVQP